MTGAAATEDPPVAEAKPVDPQAELEKKLDKLKKLIARVDSDSEHEAFSSLQKAKKLFPEINALAKQLSGEDPKLSFAEILRKADNAPEVDTAELEALREENKALWVANENYRIAEEAYKKKLDPIDAYIDSEVERKLKEAQGKNKNPLLEKIERLRQEVSQLQQDNADLASEVAKFSDLYEKTKAELEEVKENIPDHIARYSHDKGREIELKYSGDGRKMRMIERAAFGKKVLHRCLYQDGQRHGLRTVYDKDTFKMVLRENYAFGQLHGNRKVFTVDGELIVDENYAADELHGNRKEYKNGQLVIDENYANGQLHGNRKKYWNTNIILDENYASGQLQGNRKVFSAGGQLLEDENYAFGQLHGNRKQYTPDGVLIVDENYHDGQLHGNRKIYTIAGQLICDENYQSGVLHGVKKEYDMFTGHLRSEKSYRDGLLDGTTKRYDSKTGKLKSIENYQAGKKYGSFIEYTDEGDVLVEENYVDDQLHGKQKYYERFTVVGWPQAFQQNAGQITGQNASKSYTTRLKREEDYQFGEMCARTEYSVKTGHKILEEHFQHGSLCRQIKYNKKNGKPIWDKGYLHGQLHGDFILYHDNGEISILCGYNRGHLHGSHTEYNDKGQILSHVRYKNGAKHGCELLYYHENPECMHSSSDYENGALHGGRREYALNGQLVINENYKNDRLQGNRKVYTEEGQMRLDENYDFGKLSGSRKSYENGKILADESYAAGILDGSSLFYDEDENLKSQAKYKNGQRHGLVVNYKKDGRVKDHTVFLDDKKDRMRTNDIETELFLIRLGDNIKEIVMPQKAARTTRQRTQDQVRVAERTLNIT